jgi:glycosidase
VVRQFISSCLSVALSLAMQDCIASPADFRSRTSSDEIMYFLLVDRFENGEPRNDHGGLAPGRVSSGFDPTDKYFYHGGDLAGLTQRLDYIAALGATAVWLSPIFQNKPVQGASGKLSAGYHGYWITDFTRVDPHFGSNQELKNLIDAAHARNLKVYLDVVTNHTADVIAYRECTARPCIYRSLADYPFSRTSAGEPINSGFAGTELQTPENFAKLTRHDYAYTPYVPVGEATVKVPQWLNDPRWYHNRGETTYTGESTTLGDFAGLDDLMTENPRVVDGFIDIYGRWIDEFRIDGFRVDTAKHVNTQFWQRFVPAMLARARAAGIEHFHIFGEVFNGKPDPLPQIRATRIDGWPSVLDFALRAALIDAVSGNAGSDVLAQVLDGDTLYEGGSGAALSLPTFISNHDQGRFATLAREASPQAAADQLLRRTLLAHALLLTLRGVPVIYAGDEQGFLSDGGDADAREDMFPSTVASYNDNRLLGTKATTAVSNFDRTHPLFVAISRLAGLRRNEVALRRGKQVIRHYSERPGLFAVSRIDPASARELLLVFNTSNAAVQGNIAIDPDAAGFTSLHGSCAPMARVPGSYRVSLAALDYIICARQTAAPASSVIAAPPARHSDLLRPMTSRDARP